MIAYLSIKGNVSKSNQHFLWTSIALCIGAIAFIGAFWAPRKSLPSLPCPDCNFIFVSADSLRADHLGAYGYSRPTSPHFDSLAKHGLLFQKHHSTSFLTPITEAVAHTGLYPQKNGIISFRNTISSRVSTLAETFKKHGYRTFAYGTSPEFNHWPALKKSFSRGFDNYEISPRFKNDSRDWPWQNINAVFKDKAKFFLWLSAGEIHAPFGYGIENKFADLDYQGIFSKLVFLGNFHHYYDGTLYDPFSRLQLQSSRTLALNPTTKKLTTDTKVDFQFPAKLTEQDRQYLIGLYDNGVSFFDRNLAKLTQQLERAGLSDNTVIVIHSEHGESLFEHNYVAHYDLWNEVIKTPLLITGAPVQNWKAKVDVAKITNQMTSTIDLAPTFYEMALLSPSFSDGQSLLHDHARNTVFLVRTPLWESVLETSVTDRYKKFNALDENAHFKDFGLIFENYKLFHRKSRFIEEQFSVWQDLTQEKFELPEFQLFDLDRDPGELNPLPNKGPVFEKMRAKILDFETHIKNVEVESERIELLQEYK